MSRTTTPANFAAETEQNTETTQCCPLCALEAPDSDTIYVHLQTSHRKSSLATALLDARDR